MTTAKPATGTSVEIVNKTVCKQTAGGNSGIKDIRVSCVFKLSPPVVIGQAFGWQFFMGQGLVTSIMSTGEFSLIQVVWQVSDKSEVADSITNRWTRLTAAVNNPEAILS